MQGAGLYFSDIDKDSVRPSVLVYTVGASTRQGRREKWQDYGKSLMLWHLDYMCAGNG